MKAKLLFIAPLLAWLVPVGCFAQLRPPLAEPGPLLAGRQPRMATPYPLSITLHKTTSLLFPATITSVDRGSRDVLVQKAKGTQNVLQLKAGKMNFPETNLTVITADGQLRSFLVNYSPAPPDLVLDFRGKSEPVTPGGIGNPIAYVPPVLLSGGSMSEETIERSVRKIIGLPRTVHRLRDRHHQIRFSLNGLYVQEEALFFQLALKNRSNIAYDIDFVRFYLRDKQQAKRTAIQEVEVKPLLSYGLPSRVEGMDSRPWVVVMKKFTIPDGQELVVELQEKGGATSGGATLGGGRHTTLRVSSQALEKAWLLD